MQGHGVIDAAARRGEALPTQTLIAVGWVRLGAIANVHANLARGLCIHAIAIDVDHQIAHVVGVQQKRFLGGRSDDQVPRRDHRVELTIHRVLRG